MPSCNCLMWANENWTRRWDGSDQDVLLSQDYRPEDEGALIETFCRHFADPRYIRLQNRPVLMIYRAGLIPGGAATVVRWRQLFRLRGEAPILVMAQSFGERDPRLYGLDAAVEFPPHKHTEHLPQINDAVEWLDWGATARVFRYEDVARNVDLAPPPFPLIRTALPGWDNDPRRQGRGMTLHGATPQAYGAWLSRLVEAARAQPVFGAALVCINAWNEWAEGAYLEPDVHFGAAFLNATARAVAAPSLRRAARRVLLVGHDAFPAGAQLLLLHLAEAMRERGVEVAFLLLGGGALEPRYRAVAPTTVYAGAEALARDAAALLEAGWGSAIVNTSACGQACAALARAGLRCTLLLHEMPRLLRERELILRAQEGVASAAAIVFAAEFVRDRYHELVALPMERVALLPQGMYRPVDRRQREARRLALRLQPEASLAVGLGWGDLRKGFDLFLQAWRLAQAADPSWHFLWVGDLDRVVDAFLGAEIAAAEATGTFHRLPFAEDGADWLAAADVHLLTSREDPFPSVVLEAMSAGVPTVAFDEAGGAPPLLRACDAGEAVPLADVAALVRRMRALALRTEPEDRARLAALARQRFGFGDYVDRLLALAAPVRTTVSVAIPTLNYARYLPGRLQSVFAQTLAPQDVAVLDDGSRDGSRGVVAQVTSASGRAVDWVGPGRERGVFAQWRRAAEQAEGALLWIAEADDLAEPELLARLATALEAVPDARFAFCDSRAIDAKGQTLWPDHRAYYAECGAYVLGGDAVIPAARFLRECLGARNLVVNASAVLWRREALLAAFARAGRQLGEFQMAGDWLLYASALAEGGSVAFVADPLNAQRRHRRSVTARLDPEAHLAEIRRMHRIMRRLIGPDPTLAAEQRRALASARRSLTGARVEPVRTA